MTAEQEELVKEKIAFCSKKIKVLKPDEIKKVCSDFDFDRAKIDEYLKSYDVDDKYRDVPAFQWQQTVTREQKLQQRKQRNEDADRRRRREEMLRQA